MTVTNSEKATERRSSEIEEPFPEFHLDDPPLEIICVDPISIDGIDDGYGPFARHEGIQGA